jgi:hypothetical protein
VEPVAEITAHAHDSAPAVHQLQDLFQDLRHGGQVDRRWRRVRTGEPLPVKDRAREITLRYPEIPRQETYSLFLLPHQTTALQGGEVVDVVLAFHSAAARLYWCAVQDTLAEKRLPVIQEDPDALRQQAEVAVARGLPERV